MTRKRQADNSGMPHSGKFWRGVFAGMDGAPLPILLVEHKFATAPPGTNTIVGEPDTIDWFTTFRYPIGGDSSTKEGLRRRREAIENIVAPHMTKQKTQHAIRFRGKKLYVKSISAETERRKVWYAIEILQGIYHIQNAWQEGDIEGAIRLAYCVGRLDVYLETSERFESPLFKDVVTYYFAKERGGLKKGRSKLSDVPALILESAHANNRRKKNWLEATMGELTQRHNVETVSLRTLSRRLKELGISAK